MRRLAPGLAVAALLAAGALVVSGCGSSGSGSSPEGAKVFASAGCTSCHALAAANANGQIGPNLDQLKPSSEAVVRQVTSGGAGMPSFRGRLSPKQIREVADYVATSTKNSAAVSTAFHPNGTKLSDCPGNYACYKQAFGNIAYYNSPEQALATLTRYMRTNSTVSSGCHQIAHMIGHAGYLRYHGNAAEALAHGSMTCWSGYYHGVVERAFAGVPRSQVTKIARRMCTGAAINRTSFLAYQCVHGLGHGLMIYSLNDLPYSLRVCDQLPTRWDQTSCTGGVFMQNFLPGPMQIAPTKWVKQSDLLYPCDIVASRDKLYCYLMVTSRILPVVHYNWRVAARWCHRAEKGWVATCFQSFGRDASGFSVQNPRKIVSICRLAGSMERECIYGGSRDLTSNDAGPTRAIRMCKLAPASTRSFCYYGIGTILGGFANEASARRAKCAPIPSAYRHDCDRGANA
ncbi:MAG TPA: c-type cytochrome [Gaiellaceae bacterium]